MQILGGTGTGKTESVIFNLIKQDINNHHPVVVIDGKGDLSFLRFLERFSPKSTLKVFDLNGEGSLSYNPLDNGSAIEASERLFNSLTWSEEFYRLTSKAVLTKIFTYFKEKTGKNPTLLQISYVLRSKETLAEVLVDSEEDDLKDHKKTYEHVLGLKHQIETLCTGNLAKILSPTETIESFSLKESIHNGLSLIHI